jgi:cephalosporin-C deacetylase-like acetyl esterase
MKKITIPFIIFLLACKSTKNFKAVNNTQPTTVWNLPALIKPPAYKVVSSDTATIKEILYESVSYGDLPKTQVFAYYASPGTLTHQPDAPHSLPAIVFVHGGGGRAFQEFARLWAGRGYAVIAMDLAGRGKDGQRLPLGGPDQDPAKKFTSIDSPLNQQWVYHAVTNVALAHSLIRSFPEVDTNRTGITGISWGGFLTCISSGIDPRYKVAEPVYGCGFYFDTVGLNYRANLNKLSPASAKRWVEQYDPSNFIHYSKAHFLWITGAKDHHFNPSMFSKTYNEVFSQSQFSLRPDMPHGHTEGATSPEIGTFINHWLQNQPVKIPQINHLKTDQSGSFEAQTIATSPIVSATISYTQDNFQPFEKRTWKTIPVLYEKGKIKGQLPQSVTIWMLQVKDCSGLLGSTAYQFVR